MIARALGAGTGLAAVLTLAACAAVATGTAPAPPAGSVRAPALGILVGASGVDHSPQEARRCVQAARLVASYAGLTGGYVIVSGYGSGPASGNVNYSGRMASASAQNSLIRNVQVQHAEVEAVRSVRQEQAAPVAGPTDPIGGVNAMASHLGGIPHSSATVIICGDAVQTAAPIDLSDPVQLADTSAALQTVVGGGLLPNCSGWRVYMIGGSMSLGNSLADVQDLELREFWREFFVRCGGRLMVWDDALLAFPAAGPGVPPAHWTRPGTIAIPLPTSLLFEPNRAVLLSGAGRTLNELAVKLTRTYPNAAATVVGYTAAVGGPERTALRLSRARAEAVAEYLEGRGVQARRLSVAGFGDRDQIPGGWAANRRVVVTLELH